MFSERAYQAWKAHGGAVDAAERSRVRSIVEDEVNEILDGPASQRNIEAGRAHFAGVLARTRGPGASAVPPSPEQQVARRAEIRRDVEAEMRQFDAERQAAARRR